MEHDAHQASSTPGATRRRRAPTRGALASASRSASTPAVPPSDASSICPSHAARASPAWRPTSVPSGAPTAAEPSTRASTLTPPDTPVGHAIIGPIGHSWLGGTSATGPGHAAHAHTAARAAEAQNTELRHQATRASRRATSAGAWCPPSAFLCSAVAARRKRDTLTKSATCESALLSRSSSAMRSTRARASGDTLAEEKRSADRAASAKITKSGSKSAAHSASRAAMLATGPWALECRLSSDQREPHQATAAHPTRGVATGPERVPLVTGPSASFVRRRARPGRRRSGVGSASGVRTAPKLGGGGGRPEKEAREKEREGSACARGRRATGWRGQSARTALVLAVAADNRQERSWLCRLLLPDV